MVLTKLLWTLLGKSIEQKWSNTWSKDRENANNNSQFLLPFLLCPSNRNCYLAFALKQWIENVESILSRYFASFEQWKDHQNQSCQSQLQALDEEIAKIESKKAAIRQKNSEILSKATERADSSVQLSEGKIAATHEILESLGGGGQPSPSAPSADQDGNDQGPPIALCCPITLQLMTNPVLIVEDGHTYERSAILEHWKTQERQRIPLTSPKTNQRISSKHLAPNVFAPSQCHEWQVRHPGCSS